MGTKRRVKAAPRKARAVAPNARAVAPNARAVAPNARAVAPNARAVAPKAPYDVVALVASAGGHSAIEIVLRALPKTFPIPIIVMQHLAPEVVDPLRPYNRRLPFTVEWAKPDVMLERGLVLVAPPRSFVEVMPNGICVLSPCARGALDLPIDRLLQSLAQSFAHRAITVVLSGMMSDGAAGARELRAAGSCVIVQSGAEYASMPNAVIAAGAADVTLPAEDIAPLLVELAAGAPVPRRPSELESIEALFTGDGRAAAELRAVNWRDTPLGSVCEWPPALSTAVRNALSSTFPTCIYWGPEFVQIYNESFLPLLGVKPSAAGRPARLTSPELWSALKPRLESVLQTGQAVFAEDQLFQPERHGYPEEMYLTYSYSPLYDTNGRVCGVLNTSTETTGRVLASRRLEVVRDLLGMKSGESRLLVVENAAKVLANAALDVPFALFYLLQKGRLRANLAASTGVNAGSQAAPHSLELSAPGAVWPLGQIVESGSPVTLNDLASRVPDLRAGPWHDSPTSATLLPLRSGADGPIAGVAVLGLSPRLRFDPTYGDFLRVIALHVSTALGDADARQSEHERSNRLAELDRAKVDFFSNVSHEFRTPLTLLLGPLEELLSQTSALPAQLQSPIEAAARNGRRLLTLVNTLLDFSQAESQRQQARLEPTDLAALTTDIASAFRSAVEAAGLRFELRCARDVPQVAVDRQMWEKLVSNLLSNALKFTFEGEIVVEVNALALHAELVVRDSGIGIPEHELPNLFKRFHRVRGARARTSEGSGIGLWMVDDLVKRMGGQLLARSKEHAGTTFTVWIPYKTVRASAEPVTSPLSSSATAFASQAAREASRWGRGDSKTGGGASDDVIEDVFGSRVPGPAAERSEPRGRVLVADDNADMREYLERLLRTRWQVELAAGGQSALEAALETRPDVILADVMMPEFDGFELLRRVRAQPELRHTPVLLLTARTGEEAAIEGLLAGADDYIAKPFSPRELVARIAAAVDRARAEAALRKSEEALRESEASKAFQLELADALCPVSDPAEIQRTAMRVLGEHLAVDRVLYADVAPDGETALVLDNYTRDGVSKWTGTFALMALGAPAERMRDGQTAVIPSASAREESSAGESELQLAAPLCASVSVPLIKGERLASILVVHHESARQWSAAEVTRIQDAAERTWVAVERGRAENEAVAARQLAEQLNDQLRERAAWLRGQGEALSAAVNAAPLEVSLGALVRTALEALGRGTRAAFYLADEHGAGLHHVVGMPADYARQVNGFQIGPESLACGLATHKGEPVLTRDVQLDPLWQPWRWLAERFDYRGCWSFPIHSAAGKFIGTLALYWREPREATERELELASLLTNTASIIISRHREAKVRQRAEAERKRAEEALRASKTGPGGSSGPAPTSSTA